MNEFIENLKHSIAPFIDDAFALNEIKKSLYKRAKEAIINALGAVDCTYFRLKDYNPNFELAIDNGPGDVTLVEIVAIELYRGEILLLDIDGYSYEECQWGHHIFEILNAVTQALKQKADDLTRLKVGARVKWIDPAIDDYDPDDRE